MTARVESPSYTAAKQTNDCGYVLTHRLDSLDNKHFPNVWKINTFKTLKDENIKRKAWIQMLQAWAAAVWTLSYTICMCIFFPVRLVWSTVSSHAVKTCKFAVILTRHLFPYSPALGQSPSRRLLTRGPWGHMVWTGCFCKRTDIKNTSAKWQVTNTQLSESCASKSIPHLSYSL